MSADASDPNDWTLTVGCAVFGHVDADKSDGVKRLGYPSADGVAVDNTLDLGGLDGSATGPASSCAGRTAKMTSRARLGLRRSRGRVVACPMCSSRRRSRSQTQLLRQRAALRGASCGPPSRSRPPRPDTSRPTEGRRLPTWRNWPSRESADSALLAWTVVSEPRCPVLRACNRSAASAPHTSPTTMWSGRCRKAWRTRSRILTAPCGKPRASNRSQFGASIRSSRVSSMAAIRSSLGSSSMRAFRSVVLPLPVPPLTRMFQQVYNTRSASSRTFTASAPCSTSAPSRRVSQTAARCWRRTGWWMGRRSPRASLRPGAHPGWASWPGSGHRTSVLPCRRVRGKRHAWRFAVKKKRFSVKQITSALQQVARSVAATRSAINDPDP